MIRKFIVGNVGALIRVIPEILHLDEILGKYHTHSEELAYLVAVIEERMDQIWKLDTNQHRYFIEPAIWQRIPFEQKEQLLRVIYQEENTWWEICDMYSGRCLGKAGSLGPSIY